MALVATFAGDFTKFEKSLREGVVHLQAFDRATKNSMKGLQRELESLSGQKVAVEAARMAEAIKRLGGEGGVAAGALKLTDAELKRIAATLNDAAAKAAKLGEALPASIAQARDAVNKLIPPAAGAAGGLGSLGAVFAKLGPLIPITTIAGGATAILGMGKAAFESAGRVADLAQKTGLSTETIQRFEAVAAQTGSSVEAFSSAAFKLGVNIENGAKGTRKAIDELGISFDTLKGLKPEQQFEVVVRALEQVEDTTKRNALGVAIFGKQFAEFAPAIAEGYTKIADAASVASDRQIQALDRAGDALARFATRAKTELQAALGNVALLLEGSGSLLEGSSTGFGSSLENLTAQQKQLIAVTKKNGGDLVAVFKQIAEAQAAARKEFEQANPMQGPPAEAITKTRDYVKELAALRAKLAELKPAEREQLDAGLKLTGVTEDLANQFGLTEDALKLYQSTVTSTNKSLEEGDNFTARWNDSQVEFQREMKKSTDELLRFIEKANLKSLTSPDESVKLAERLTKPIADAIQSNAKQQVQLQNELTTLVQQKTLSRTEFQIAQVQRWAKTEKAQLDKTAGAWRENQRLIDEIANRRIQDLIDEEVTDQIVLFANLATDAKKRVKELNAEALAAQREGLKALAGAFATLAQVTGGIDGKLGSIADAIAMMSLAAEAGAQFNTGLERLKKDGIDNTIAGLTSMSASIAAVAGAFLQATDRAGKAARAFAGAAVGAQAGAQIGGAIGGPFGAAVGAGIGALAGLIGGLLRKPAFEDIMRRVGREWGTQISEELARSIALDAKTLFGGDRQTAEVFNFGKILEEAGGLNDLNFDRFLARFRDVFVLFGQGRLSLQQTQQVLEENFAAFADHVLKSGEIASKEFLELIKLNQQFGTESQAIAEFIRGQAARAGSALVDIFAGANSAEEFERLGVLALGAFNAAIEGGLSFREALEAVAPALDRLQELMGELGLEADAALKPLIVAQQVSETTAGNAAAALSEAILALSNFNALNEQTLDALEGQLSTVFARVQGEVAALGGTHADALRQVLPFLEQALRASEEFGLTLDPATRELIDQARELGLLGQAGEEETDIMREGFESVVDAVHELTDAILGIPAAAREAANALADIKLPPIDRRRPDPGGDGGFNPDDPGPIHPSAIAASRVVAGVTRPADAQALVLQPVFVFGQAPPSAIDAAIAANLPVALATGQPRAAVTTLARLAAEEAIARAS